MPKISVGKAALESRPHILYRFYDRTGVLLYVGITVDFETRMAAHSKDKAWWSQVDRKATHVEYHDCRRDALDAERDAIRAERPVHNDHHNEWVELETDSPDEARQLALDILSTLEPRDREAALQEASVDWDEQPVTGRDLDLEAARAGVNRLWAARYDLAKLVGQYMDLLPDGEGEVHRRQAREDYVRLNPDDDYSETAVAELMMRSLLRMRAGEILGTMPHDEAREWIASGRTILARTSKLDEAIVFGATYANLFKQHGTTFAYLCNGPGRFGARCPSKAQMRTFFELCSYCTDNRACEGHRFWCEAHATAAAAGDLAMLTDDPAVALTIARSEPLSAQQDPWNF